MGRRNFVQILNDAKVDIQREYYRLYSLFYSEKSLRLNGRTMSLRDYCASCFQSLLFRGTCLTLDDFDDFYGFSFEAEPSNFNLDYLLTFCEYSYNIIICTYPDSYDSAAFYNVFRQKSQFYLQQIMKVVDIIGYMIVKPNESDEMTIIVMKSPAAIAVAENLDTKLAYRVLEYNHYNLKGKLDQKLNILKNLADEIEPRRSELKQIQGSVENELFQLFHKFVRHNNKDNRVISSMSKEEMEAVYDDIYQMWLLAMLELDNVDRKKRVKELLGRINGEKTRTSSFG